VGERDIDGDTAPACLPLQAPEDDDAITLRDRLFRNEASVERSVEVGQESFEQRLHPLEAPGAGGHPFRQLVDDVGGLEREERLAVSGREGLVEGVNVLHGVAVHLIASACRRAARMIGPDDRVSRDQPHRKNPGLEKRRGVAVWRAARFTVDCRTPP
jgi:hypothetical protein